MRSRSSSARYGSPERAVRRSLREQAKTASTSSPARRVATVVSATADIAPDHGLAAGRDSATVDRMQPLRWERRPDGLRAPALVCAFKGWNDAGEAATSALTFMGAGFDATRFALIDPEEFVDFQSTRPSVRMVDGLTRKIEWPEFEFYEARIPRAPRDLILLSGPEPAMRWRTFCEKVIELAEAIGVQMVVTMGALLADVPHTRPVSITGMASDQGLIDRLSLQPPTYEGPTGIVGVLHAACADAGMPSASLWAAVPHYVAVAPEPEGRARAAAPAREPRRRHRRRPRPRDRRRRLRPPGHARRRARPRGPGVRRAPRARRRRGGAGRRPRATSRRATSSRASSSASCASAAPAAQPPHASS